MTLDNETVFFSKSSELESEEHPLVCKKANASVVAVILATATAVVSLLVEGF